MIAQIEITNEMDWTAMLVALDYNAIIEAANKLASEIGQKYGQCSDVVVQAYFDHRMANEIGNDIALIQTYIDEAEHAAFEAELEFDEDYIDWLASVNSGIPMF